MFILLAKMVCLVLGIAYGCTCLIRGSRGLNVSGGQILSMALGIAGFVTLQWLL